MGDRRSGRGKTGVRVGNRADVGPGETQRSAIREKRTAESKQKSHSFNKRTVATSTPRFKIKK